MNTVEIFARSSVTTPKASRLQRMLRGTGIFLLTIIVLVYLALPADLGVFALLPSRAEVGPPPQGFKEVTLRAEGGVELQAW